MQKVTGIGGVFFKASNPRQLMEWYDQHLGLTFTHGFMEFKWVADQDDKTSASTTFAIFKEDASNFEPSEKPFMINFRVADLKGLLSELKEKGVTIIGEVEEYDFGNFGRIMDPEGNKIELWEPK